MELFKAFDYIPHNVIIAKLRTYGITREYLTLIYPYFKGCKQCVRINNT